MRIDRNDWFRYMTIALLYLILSHQISEPWTAIALVIVSMVAMFMAMYTLFVGERDD